MAQYNAAEMFETKRNDATEARKWYELSAAQGFKGAISALARLDNFRRLLNVPEATPSDPTPLGRLAASFGTDMDRLAEAARAKGYSDEEVADCRKLWEDWHFWYKESAGLEPAEGVARTGDGGGFVFYKQYEAEAAAPLTAAALVAELNRLRADPAAYAAVLEGTLELFKDDKSFWPREPGAQPFMTHEGRDAVVEAIAALRAAAAPLPALAPYDGMDAAAGEHADDLVACGERLGHTGSDGSRPAERLARHGRWFERASECLAYRHLTAPLLVAQLVVDDGMASRTQRATVLSADMRAVGCAIRDHGAHGVVAVLTFAGGYGPFPLEDAATVECAGGAPDDAFNRVLDSIPVVAVHEQVAEALGRGDKVQLNYEPGALKMTIWAADGTGQMFGVDWEK